jgi:hypothetical protein
VTDRLTVRRLVNINLGRPRTSSTAVPRKPQHHHLRSPRSESKSFSFLKQAQGIKRAIKAAGEGGGAAVLTVYFGTPNMFITLWFGFGYGTNPPLGTLIILQVHLCACIWNCCVYVGKHGHNGRIRNKFKGAFMESCSCS